MKRFRSFLIFFIPFVLFFMYFTNQHGHNFSANTTHTEHGYVEIPEGYEVPSVKVIVSQDPSKNWLLEVQTENFTFTPKKVASTVPSYNEGHAHLYINGEKMNRLYGKYYDLGNLKKGKNTIRVTLNSNNHGFLSYHRKPIETSVMVDVASYINR